MSISRSEIFRRKKGDRTLKFGNVHCQKQWASLGVKFSGGKKGAENEKSWEVNVRSVGGHDGRSVRVQTLNFKVGSWVVT